MTDTPRPVEQMTADDWEHFLEREDVILVVRDTHGIHYFEHNGYENQLAFFAYGGQGYDYAGSRAALEATTDYPEESLTVLPGPDEFREMANRIAESEAQR